MGRTSKTDGHIICTQILSVTHWSQPKESLSHWSQECDLNLSAPTEGPEDYMQRCNNVNYYLDSNDNIVGAARREFDRELGPMVMIVGNQRTEREETGAWKVAEHPLDFLRLMAHAMQKVGTGNLMVDKEYMSEVENRHLRVGGNIPMAKLRKCRCDKVSLESASGNSVLGVRHMMAGNSSNRFL
jgi:hypothetical protein